MLIQKKISLSFIAFCLLLIIFLSIIFLFFSRNLITDLVGNYNALLAKSYTEAIDQIINNRLESWDLYIKNNTNIIKTIEKSNADFELLDNRIEYINYQDRIWTNAAIEEISDFMSAIINNQVSNDLRKYQSLYKNEYGYEVFPEVFITNKYGANVAQTNKTSDYNQGDEYWWQQSKEKGFWVSDVIFDESSKSVGLEIGIKINDENNNFLGIGKVFYNIRDIINLVDQITNERKDSDLIKINIPRKTVIALLLTSDGKLIYSTKDGLGNFADKKEIIEPFLNNADSHKAYFLKNENGTEKLFVHAHSLGYQNFEGTNLLIVITKNTSEAFSSLLNFYYIIIILSFCVLIVSIFIAYHIASSIIKPIKKLEKGIKIIENGDLDFNVKIKGNDETSILSQSFDRMVKNIKESRKEIEEKVQQQTTEIIQQKIDLENQQKATLNILEDVEKEKIKSQEEKIKYESLLTSIGDGVIATTAEGKVIFINEIALKMLSLGNQDFVGKTVDSLAVLKDESGKEVPLNNRPITKCLKSKERIIENKYYYVRKDNSQFAAAITVTPVILEKKLIGIIEVFRDISKERSIDKAKTEFVSLASHQLRTPLSTINWYAEMLLAGDAGQLSTDQKKYLEEIYTGNQRMVALVNSLLNVSRLELGTFMVEPEKINLIDVLKTVILELQPLIKEKKLNLELIAKKDELDYFGDPKLLNIIFQNLISNAVKYTPVEGRVMVEAKKGDKDFIIKVLDNGYGIPQYQQNKIFEKLFRADNVRQKDVEGTGLGLYIVKAIVDYVGGKIIFFSEENKGTTFEVLLPLAGMKKKEGIKKIE